MSEHGKNTTADEVIVIVQIGVTTAVGLDGLQTCASVRAGISGFYELDWMDKVAHPFVAAFLPDDCLPPISGRDRCEDLDDRAYRMLGLAQMALEQIQGVEEAVALMLGWPEKESPPCGAEPWLARLSDPSPVPIDTVNSRVFETGRASGLTALHHACKVLRAGQAEALLVGAVDTYKDLVLMGRLDRAARIKSPANLDGSIPGEGAGFLLVTSLRNARVRQWPVICTVESTAVGFEEGHLFSEAPYRGEGLAATVDALVGAAPTQLDRPRCIFSSMNGEYYWAKEWGVAAVRCRDYLDPEARFEHPADCFGDMGAACGPGMVALAAIGMQKGYLPGPALVYGASDGGERAAALVARLEER